MIYFDNAATTWPKPDMVKAAIIEALDKYGANPGRGSYEMALNVSRLIFETRLELASFFNIQTPNRIVFTKNATESLNIALKGFLRSGDHVVFTSMEHNAVYRPLKVLEQQGVKLSLVKANSDGTITPDMIEKMIIPETKLVVITHASNVTGSIMPLQEIGDLVKPKQIKLLVDCAQSAGFLDIDVQKQKIDMLAFPGHKSLYGPTGIGGLYIGNDIELQPLYQGGTGSLSHSWEQPTVLPDQFESGTLNTMGIAGLRAGIKFIKQEGLNKIREHEEKLTKKFLKGLTKYENIKVYGPDFKIDRAPVVSINIGNNDPGEIAFMLDKVYGIGVRSGFHCAPLAHETIGTENQGTVRFSFGYFNTEKEIDLALDAIGEIVKEVS